MDLGSIQGEREGMLLNPSLYVRPTMADCELIRTGMILDFETLVLMSFFALSNLSRRIDGGFPSL